MIAELGKHAVPVLGAYGAAILLIAALVVFTWWQARAAKNKLDRLEIQLKQGNSDG